MNRTYTERKRIRKTFEKITPVIPMPNLISVLKDSYAGFLQFDTQSDERKDRGLEGVFNSIFPISSSNGEAVLEFVKYDFDEPKYDVVECRQRGATFAAPVRVTLSLTVYEINEDTGAKTIKEIRAQEVYIGDVPLMTDNATFIINGTERVIISQMHRSPGVFFDSTKGTGVSATPSYSARVIPYRGSWLEFEFDSKDILNVRIDRRSKLPVTTLLYALDKPDHKDGEERGYSKREILNYFYNIANYTYTAKGWVVKVADLDLIGHRVVNPIVDAKTGETLLQSGKKITKRALKKWAESGVTELLVDSTNIVRRYVGSDVMNNTTGEILLHIGDEITPEYFELDSEGKNLFEKAGVSELDLLEIDWVNTGGYIRETLSADKNNNREEALLDIHRMLRPGDPPTIEIAEVQLNDTFFNENLYDLSTVGRMKMNVRLNVGEQKEIEDKQYTLTPEDIFRTVKTLHELRDGYGEIDDIDHLGNRRVRSVGELMENQLRVGLVRMERNVRERINSADLESAMPNDLINAKPVSAAVLEFFSSSQLSQFMDQTNPLSEVTHKRRFSALGPGGMTRERAGFEVRDVHTSHYGRICPIETPEGPNIGLINSLANFGRVNKYGFIETPYRRVVDGKVTKEVDYLSAIEEWRYNIAQANALLNGEGEFANDLVNCRKAGELMMVPKEDIRYIDVSPKQIVSVAAALIPFLENDDANRALMGANMQRQAVPLLKAEAPFVGTGMEATVARDSGVTIIAKRSGVIQQVDANRIVVRVLDEQGQSDGVDIYKLMKFERSNQNTCIIQKPLVMVGDMITAGDIIGDGSSTDMGELALGRNVLVAFMPWNGYNYEDSILISERIARDDVFTSIHIEELEIMARDTKLGEEEITRDIPNVGEDALRNLDETGVVYVGAKVSAGDILVGKVTPKGETPVTPEEKLLRAIFGEKSSDYRDTSLRLHSGTQGVVVDVRVFNRRGVEKDERTKAIDQNAIDLLSKYKDDERGIYASSFRDRMYSLLDGQTITSSVSPKIRSGAVIKTSDLDVLREADLMGLSVEDDEAQSFIESAIEDFSNQIKDIDKNFEDKVTRMQRGNDLPTGVLKYVKVYVAVKRKLQPGDKMAGRHGNKGVVSRILPLEDMPFLEDGTQVDIVLNPLGVPSRMNIGQILETHLGWAAAGLGKQIGESLDEAKRTGKFENLRSTLKTAYERPDVIEDIDTMSDDEITELSHNLRPGVPMATPVFDGAKETDIARLLEKAGVNTSGQSDLYDGRTGEKFDRPVTVGYIYMLKLHHLVDEKMHARSIGPYSLVTQQPLGGKAQFGGQRFGEMEVWALEAYGAAYTLQEMLTVKSDDVSGRTKVYESIVRAEQSFETGIPESFNVLIKELQALGLNMELK